MTTHLLWAFIALIITGCTTRTDISLPVNEIKQGVAEVTIKVNDQSEIMSAKDIVGEVYWKPLLDYNYVDTVNLIPEPRYYYEWNGTSADGNAIPGRSKYDNQDN